jgi:hypothetical protein
MLPPTVAVSGKLTTVGTDADNSPMYPPWSLSGFITHQRAAAFVFEPAILIYML